jgi:iron complex transport system ATP-binding protein
MFPMTMNAIAPSTHDGSLAVSGLHAGYGKKDVIRGLSMPALQAGRLTALLGPNGSGKSTLLKAMAGLVPLRRGRVAFDGRDLGGLPSAARSRLIAYMPQSLPAAVHLRVLESVLVAARAHAPGSMEVGPDAASALLSRLGIGHLALSYLDELSGGQKQLAGLAQALIREPRVLLLDEPLSALDLHHRFQVMALLRRETEARGLVTLMVMHDLDMALRHTDRAVLVGDGLLVAEGMPMEVITPATLARVYGVAARIERCTRGQPHLVIDKVLDDYRAPD